MSMQYKNFQEFLNMNDFIVITTEQEFLDTKTITFTCQDNHINEMKSTSFINKKSKFKDNPKNMCLECYHFEENKEKFEKLKEKILETTGHTLLSLEKNRVVSYKCGNCEEEGRSNSQSLLKNKGNCPKCQNDKFKNSDEKVKTVLEEKGYKFVSYENNKSINIKCKNNHEFNTSLNHIKNGRGCPECSGKRRENTVLEKYGTKNVFQSEKIKDKIRETNLEKYGETHHMKIDDIKEKAKNTMVEKYGIKYAFHSDESFEKIRKTCLERYGAEFPLQSAFIQTKIKQTFRESLGVDYPMMNQEYWQEKYKQACLEYYGVTNYSKTDEFKEKYKQACLKNYGVTHYSKTDEFKEKCKETSLLHYGVPHPMQNPEVFSRALSSSFTKKEYKFPNGRIEYVLGYEASCLNELIKIYNEDDIIVNCLEIPVISYAKAVQVDEKDKPILTRKTKSPSNKVIEREAKYYPDIYVPDKLIEVKSLYTYILDLENTRRKMIKCLEEGYCVEIWVYKDETTLLKKFTFTPENKDILNDIANLEINDV